MSSIGAGDAHTIRAVRIASIASRRVAIQLVLFALVWSISSTRVYSTEQEYTGQTMGPVQYRVLIGMRPESITREELATEIQQTLDRVNDAMSTYDPDSEISRFNVNRSTDWFEVSSATAEVVERAIELSQLTDGAFDITVMPLVNLWQFGPEPSSDEIPDQSAIQGLLAHVGYEHLEARLEPPGIRKSNPNVTIDLSAIAKGYAVDQVAEFLDELGVQDYMVEVGGEVRTRGVNASGAAWVIGIERPIVGVRSIDHRVSVSNTSLATSGDYRNFVVIDGVTFSHTIDPATGRPVEHGLASASVIAEDCMTADAIATALMVAGPSKVEEIASRVGIEALWIVRQEDSLDVGHTPNFPFDSSLADQNEQGGNQLLAMAGAAVIVFAVALIGMSVGVIFSNRTIKGSCGGLSALKDGDVSSPCDICNARSQCDEFQKAATAAQSSSD